MTTNEVVFRKSSFQEDLQVSDLCNYPSGNLDEMLSRYVQILKSTLDRHAPLHKKTMVVRPRVPWFSKDLKESKRRRRKAERN